MIFFTVFDNIWWFFSFLVYCYHQSQPSPGISSFIPILPIKIVIQVSEWLFLKAKLVIFLLSYIVMWGIRKNIHFRSSCSWFSIHLYCTLGKGSTNIGKVWWYSCWNWNSVVKILGGENISRWKFSVVKIFGSEKIR